MSEQKKFEPPVCGHCGQTTQYEMRIDRGSALIVLAVGNAVRAKDKNLVHLLGESVQSPKEGGYETWREMVADGRMTFRMVCNASRPVRFGLIRPVKQGSGEYFLTPRGAQFLQGKPVPRRAVIDKKTHHKLYYRIEEDVVTIGELLGKDADFWDGQQARFEKNETMERIAREQTLFDVV